MMQYAVQSRYIFTTLLFGLVFILTTSSVQAQSEPYTLGTFLIPKMVEREDRGVFIDLVREIERRTGIAVTIEVWPPERSFKYFQDQKIIGMFPTTSAKVQTAVPDAAFSVPFYIKTEFIFTRKGDAFTRIEDLEGKRVGLTFGYGYSEELTNNENIQIFYTKDDVTNMKNLALGRIDAFIVEEVSGLKALELCGCADDITYHPAAQIAASEIIFAFQPNAQGRQLAAQFSDAIRAMQEDGTLQQILQQDPED